MGEPAPERPAMTPQEEADVGNVISALETEARGQPRGPLHEDEIRRFALESLFEELLAEPSNVFLHHRVDAQTTRYEAMQRSFWQRCLAELRRRCKV